MKYVALPLIALLGTPVIAEETRVILSVWPGIGQALTQSMHVFEGKNAKAWCEGAKTALIEAWPTYILPDDVKCIPFTAPQPPVTPRREESSRLIPQAD